MKIAKKSSNNNRELRGINSDLISLFNAIQGRISFGSGVDGERGENIYGEFQTVTSHASANTEFSLSHGLGSVPIGYLILGQDKAGSLYQLKDTGTAWTVDTIYLKCSVSSVSFLLFLLK